MSDFVYLTEDLVLQDEKKINKLEVGIRLREEDGETVVKFINDGIEVKVADEKLSRFNPENTGDQYENKICNRCNRFLPVNNFQKNQNGKNNRTVRRPSCNDCRKLIDGKKVPAKLKKEWNKKKPHMIVWECPVCKKKTIPGLTSKVVLDHDHETGMPRAWICDSCNTGLGRFKDDTETIKNATKYLKKYK